VQRPGAPGADPTPQAGEQADAPVRASDDTDRAWGDAVDHNDERLRHDVPPHYGKTH